MDHNITNKINPYKEKGHRSALYSKTKKLNLIAET